MFQVYSPYVVVLELYCVPTYSSAVPRSITLLWLKPPQVTQRHGDDDDNTNSNSNDNNYNNNNITAAAAVGAVSATFSPL